MKYILNINHPSGQKDSIINQETWNKLSGQWHRDQIADALVKYSEANKNVVRDASYELMCCIYSDLNGPDWIHLHVYGYRRIKNLLLILGLRALEAAPLLMDEYKEAGGESQSNHSEKFHSRLEMLYAYLELLYEHRGRLEFKMSDKIFRALDSVSKLLFDRAQSLILVGHHDHVFSESELMVMARAMPYVFIEQRDAKILKAMPFTSATTHARLAVLIGHRREILKGIRRMWYLPQRPWLALGKTAGSLLWLCLPRLVD